MGVGLTGLAACSGAQPEGATSSAPPSASVAGGVQVALYEMTVGTCIPLAELQRREGGDTNIVYTTVPCEQLHAAEFYHVDPDYYGDLTAAPEPSAANVEAAKKECSTALVEYTGGRAPQLDLDSLIWAPGPDSWAAGQRSLICLTYKQEPSGAITQWSGSLQAG